MKLSFVYILHCADDTYYTGVTFNLDKRLTEHHSAKYPESYTAQRLPVDPSSIQNSQILIMQYSEKQIKNWSQAKKQALIAGRYDELPNLAKKKFKK